MKLQRISKSLELPCGCEPGHWLYSIASCSFWRGAQRILSPSLFMRASTHLAAGTAPSATPVPINESSSLHHLCWESLGFVLRWSTDQASRLSSCNSCHGKIPSLPLTFTFIPSAAPAEQPWRGWNKRPARAHSLQYKPLQWKSCWWFPDLARAVLIPGILHQQSCVSTRVFTIIAVLAK